MAKKQIKKALPVKENFLVPNHIKLNDKEKKEFLKKFNINIVNMPKIGITDSAIADLNCKEGDVVKIERTSPTAGHIDFYRSVINE